MNKRYASILALGVVSGATWAQQANREVRTPSAPVERRGHITAPVASDRAILWSDDFGTPANWTISNEPDAFPGVTWQVGTGLESTGQYGTPAIQSTTADNGYAMVCSDCGGNEDGDQYELCNLTTTNSLDFSDKPYLILEFQTQYRRFTNEQCYVSISTDGVNFPQPPSDTATIDLPTGLYPVWFDGELTNGISPGNPTVKRINISAAAGMQGQVWVRFFWYGIWGYAWYVDDVNIFEQYNYDTGLESAYVSHTGSGDEYGRVPSAQLSNSINVGGTVTNFGVNPQTNVILNAETRDASNTVVLSHQSAAFDLAPEASNFVDDEVSITGPWPTGLYTTKTWVTSADQAIDEDILNDTLVRVFEVTADADGIYSLDGEGVYPNVTLSSIGTNSFTDNTDGVYCLTNYVADQNFMAYGVWVGIQSTSVAEALMIASVHDSANVVWDADQTPADGDVSQPYVTSNDYFLTQADIDAGFAVIPFNEGVQLEPGIGYMAGVQLFSNAGATNVRVLDDNTVPQTAWGSAIYLPDGDNPGTFSNGNAFLIRLLLNPTVGMEEREELAGVSVFPNPTNGLVNVTFTVPGAYTVQLINGLGEQVATYRLNGNSNVDLSGLAKGVYSVRISNTEKTTVKRIAVN